MAIQIDDDFMILEIDGTIVAEAKRRAGVGWEVTCRPRLFDRNHAIAALTVIEVLESGRHSDDPLVLALRGELR